MDSVHDQASAEKAIEKFRGLASQFAAVGRAEKAMGEPSADDRKTVLKIVHEANGQFDTAYEKLGKQEALFAIVTDALDKAYVGEEF